MKTSLLFSLTIYLILGACTATPPIPTLDPTKYGTDELDLTYCTMNDLPQKMDVYYPASGGPWPVVLYVHGGGWVEGDKAEGAGWQGLNDHGYMVVSINYRLASYDNKFPDMIEDVKCAVRYLRAHAGEYNIDSQRIATIGASAGGHLVALLGLTDDSAGWDMGEYTEQSSRVQAVVMVAGPSDFTVEAPSSIAMTIYYAFGHLPGPGIPEMALASPVSYVSSDDPPFLILHGDADGIVLVEQSQVLHAKLVEAGVSSKLVIVENGDHGLGGVKAPMTQEEISNLIIEFLDMNLK